MAAAEAEHQALGVIFKLHVIFCHLKWLVAVCFHIASLNTIIYVLQTFSWLANFSLKWVYNQNHPVRVGRPLGWDF